MISLQRKPATRWKITASSFTCVLMLLLSLNCRAGLTVSSIILGDTLIRTQIDSVQKLTPVKYYLTEQGARLAAKAKIDADAYFAQLKIPSRRLTIKPETCSKLRWRGTLPWLKLNRMPPWSSSSKKNCSGLISGRSRSGLRVQYLPQNLFLNFK